MLVLTGQDFNGGEFFIKRMNSGQAGTLWSKVLMVGRGTDKVVEVASTEGDLILFAANKAAVHGTDFKHGACHLRFRSAFANAVESSQLLRSEKCVALASPQLGLQDREQHPTNR